MSIAHWRYQQEERLSSRTSSTHKKTPNAEKWRLILGKYGWEKWWQGKGHGNTKLRWKSVFKYIFPPKVDNESNRCLSKRSHIMSTKKLQTGDAVNSETLKAMTKGSNYNRKEGKCWKRGGEEKMLKNWAAKPELIPVSSVIRASRFIVSCSFFITTIVI